MNRRTFLKSIAMTAVGSLISRKQSTQIKSNNYFIEDEQAEWDALSDEAFANFEQSLHKMSRAALGCAEGLVDLKQSLSSLQTSYVPKTLSKKTTPDKED